MEKNHFLFFSLLLFLQSKSKNKSKKNSTKRILVGEKLFSTFFLGLKIKSDPEGYGTILTKFNK
jgi:hypothetical protein